MGLFRKATIVLITLSLLIVSGCKTPEEPGSMQPYDGYPLLTSKEEIKKTLVDRGVGAIEFRKGEIIADIGAGNGYIEAMLSIFHDSLTFYIQDIDTSVCNQRTIDEVVDFYQEVNGKPFTNKFIAVNGTDSETNLPDSTFDKILMIRTYLYLKEPRTFILEVRENLKNDGLFYVINPLQTDWDIEYANSLRQEHGWNMSPLEKQISDIIDWGFELVRISRIYEGYEDPFTMVFKKKEIVTRP